MPSGGGGAVTSLFEYRSRELAVTAVRRLSQQAGGVGGPGGDLAGYVGQEPVA
jgi:hypothetical protein